jgi:hypothetical protein
MLETPFLNNLYPRNILKVLVNGKNMVLVFLGAAGQEDIRKGDYFAAEAQFARQVPRLNPKLLIQIQVSAMTLKLFSVFIQLFLLLLFPVIFYG